MTIRPAGSRPSFLLVFALLGIFSLPAQADEPTLSVRIEAAGSLGLNEEPTDHGLGVHFGGQALVRVMDGLGAGIRIAGQFFPPHQTLADFDRQAYEVGA